MGAELAAIAIALLLAAAGLQIRGRRRLSCWLLVVFPGFLCLAYLRDLSLGPARLGAAAYVSDQKQLVVALAMVAVSIFAAFRAEWRWLFWIEWCLNAIVCGMLIYLVFFWKVFS
jgi:hypothetical protein